MPCFSSHSRKDPPRAPRSVTSQLGMKISTLLLLSPPAFSFRAALSDSRCPSAQVASKGDVFSLVSIPLFAEPICAGWWLTPERAFLSWSTGVGSGGEQGNKSAAPSTGRAGASLLGWLLAW